MFEGLSEKDPKKRMELHDVLAHPWTKGLIYTDEELQGVMREKIAETFNVTLRKYQEKAEMRKFSSMIYSPFKEEMEKEKLSLQKIGKSDGAMLILQAECEEINKEIEKKFLVHPKLFDVESKSLQDDKMHLTIEASIVETKKEKPLPVEVPHETLSDD